MPCFPVVDFNSPAYSSLGFALKHHRSNSETSDLDSQITPVKSQAADVATDEFPDIMDIETEQFPMRYCYFLYKLDIANIRKSE